MLIIFFPSPSKTSARMNKYCIANMSLISRAQDFVGENSKFVVGQSSIDESRMHQIHCSKTKLEKYLTLADIWGRKIQWFVFGCSLKRMWAREKERLRNKMAVHLIAFVYTHSTWKNEENRNLHTYLQYKFHFDEVCIIRACVIHILL